MTKREKNVPAVEVNLLAKQIKEQHESSRSVFTDGKKVKEGLPLVDQERFSSLYEVDYHQKKVSPSTPRPCSVTRRNNPHPSQMFMHWKVPTRLIVDEPSYQQQKASLLTDSHQRFYEDINGKRTHPPASHEVLTEVGRLRGLGPQKLASYPMRHVARTHTTHYSTPYGMFKQMREMDLENELKKSTDKSKTVPHLPAVPKSGSGFQLTSVDPLSKERMERSLQPKAVPLAEKWLRNVSTSEKSSIQKALRAADQGFVAHSLEKTLQPDAKKAVEKWLETANERDREIAIQFFGSLAGSKLMGARDGLRHDLHTDTKGDILCKMCDGDRLKQVLTTLKKGAPIAAVRMRKDVSSSGAERRHLRLLTPNTRNRKEEFQTWHHLPSFRHNGPVSNTIALFTRPHKPINRHFTIHPEWD